jgi:hypothetical protein
MGEMNIPMSLYQRLSDAKPIGDAFSQQLSKLEKTLRVSGALPLRGLIERTNIGNRGRQQGYSLNLQPNQVHIHKPEGSASLPSSIKTAAPAIVITPTAPTKSHP